MPRGTSVTNICKIDSILSHLLRFAPPYLSSSSISLSFSIANAHPRCHCRPHTLLQSHPPPPPSEASPPVGEHHCGRVGSSASPHGGAPPSASRPVSARKHACCAILTQPPRVLPSSNRNTIDPAPGLGRVRSRLGAHDGNRRPVGSSAAPSANSALRPPPFTLRATLSVLSSSSFAHTPLSGHFLVLCPCRATRNRCRRTNRGRRQGVLIAGHGR